MLSFMFATGIENSVPKIREQAKARANQIALRKLALSMLKEPALPESSRKLPEEVVWSSAWKTEREDSNGDWH